MTALVLTYNHEAFLPTTLESVRSQTLFDEIAVLVSDDCSSDQTLTVASEFRDRHWNVSLRRNSTNLGTMAHYCEALATINTPYVALLEGDDIWHNPTKLEHQLEFLTAHQSVCAVFSGYHVMYDTGQIDPRTDIFSSRHRYGTLYFEELLANNAIGSFSNCMYRTVALRETLRKDLVIRGYDWLTNLLIADKSPIGFVPGDYTTYRVHNRGLWSKMHNEEQQKMILDTLEALGPNVDVRHRATVEAKIHALHDNKDAIL